MIMKDQEINRSDEVFIRSNLTRSQFLIWMGQEMAPQVPLYNMVLTFSINGPLEPETFKTAFEALISVSDAMRTVFATIDGVPFQRVLDDITGGFTFIDFSNTTTPQEDYRRWVDQHAVVNFDLTQRAFDSALIKIGDDQFVWYLNQHHLITDGWSSALVFRSMVEIYGQIRNRNTVSNTVLPRFLDYVGYERNFRGTRQFRKAADYWHRQTALEIDPIRFYGKHGIQYSTVTERVTVELDRETTRKLRDIAAMKEVRSLTLDMALFNIFATILFTYLYRVSGGDRLAIGTPAHNRPTKIFKNTIGLFIELFPMTVEIDNNETFLTLIKKVAVESSGLLGHAYPGLSSPETSRNYNVVLNYINASFSDFDGLPVETQWIHPGFGDIGHSLRLQVHDFDRSGKFILHFDFNCDAFPEAHRRWAISQVTSILNATISDLNQPLNAVEIVSSEERNRLLIDFNRSDDSVTHTETVVQLLEDQCITYAESIAIIDGDQELTYLGIHDKTSRLAVALRRIHVQEGVTVGVCIERSIDLIVAILGVLKAGGAYVPMDPADPDDRNAYIAIDSHAALVLTEKRLISKFDPLDVPTICVETVWDEDTADLDISILSEVRPEQLAYIIYTSGSTGNPKGVMISHANLTNYIVWARNQYVEDDRYSFPLFTSFSFDMTVTSIFVPLISGGKIIIYPDTVAGGDFGILQVIEDDRVDIVKLTPSHLSLIREVDSGNTRIKKLIVGGEDFKAGLADSVSQKFRGKILVFNEYGPTETTVASTVHRYDNQTDTCGSVPIGKPINNTRVYLLNDNTQLVPIGVAGEICISGSGVARGYCNNEDLTRERFIDSPFDTSKKLYRTGDFGRWRQDGVLELIGRKDRQVKVKGVRIELDEIESALIRDERIDRCVVDVTVTTVTKADSEGSAACAVCGISDSHPDVVIHPDGVCNICVDYGKYRVEAQAYFGTKDDLECILDDARSTGIGDYDCLMLLSGGKDSTYVLYQLLEMRLRILAITLDNGFISEAAKENILRVVKDVNVDHQFVSTPSMNAIFVESLNRYSNVCNGCFKTIYTLSMNIAKERGIRYIVTGLSRGQIFETRLADLFRNRVFDPEIIDATITEARKAYHQMDDEISRSMNVEIFKDEHVFDEIQFVDFYRYVDVDLSEILNFLERKAPWIRPADTGRSTNCLINEVGIYLHKRNRGYHNYALPYSWDVRLAHKKRDEAMQELEDVIDLGNVRKILRDIGYSTESLDNGDENKQLVAYYVANETISVSELRSIVSAKLPDSMIPARYVKLDSVPLTSNGKIDYGRLHKLSNDRPETDTCYVAPHTDIERDLVGIWSDVLGLEKVGLNDNFIELGGDSILNIQIVLRASRLGYRLTPRQLFEFPTVKKVSQVIQKAEPIYAEQEIITGSVPLTPVQHWYFATVGANHSHWNQAVTLSLSDRLDPRLLERAFQILLRHHDALRTCFDQDEAGWRQWIRKDDIKFVLRNYDLRKLVGDNLESEFKETVNRLHRNLHLVQGDIVRAALFRLDDGLADRLTIIVHHLAIDGLSWWPLLQDLEDIYQSLSQNDEVSLPRKTISYQSWANGLLKHAQSKRVVKEVDYWTSTAFQEKTFLPNAFKVASPNLMNSMMTVRSQLSKAETEDLVKGSTRFGDIRLTEILLSAILKAYHRWTGRKSMRIDIESHGRENIAEGFDLSRSVGWFTAIYPIHLNIGNINDHDGLIKAVKQRLNGTPNAGIGYGLLRFLNHDADIRERFDGIPESPILFNYLGHIDQILPDTSIFQFFENLSLSRSPESKRAHVIEINSVISDGILTTEWGYDSDVFDSSTIIRLSRWYTEALHGLIRHCLTRGRKYYTPSDFPESDLDQEELDMLIAEYSEDTVKQSS